MLNCPVICLVGEEAWKAKEVKTDATPAALWGDRATRGVHWEVATALPLLEAGADVAGAAPSRGARGAAPAHRRVVRSLATEPRGLQMGLTGLQIFKLLPNTNCKECG